MLNITSNQEVIFSSVTINSMKILNESIEIGLPEKISLLYSDELDDELAAATLEQVDAAILDNKAVIQANLARYAYQRPTWWSPRSRRETKTMREYFAPILEQFSQEPPVITNASREDLLNLTGVSTNNEFHLTYPLQLSPNLARHFERTAEEETDEANAIAERLRKWAPEVDTESLQTPSDTTYPSDYDFDTKRGFDVKGFNQDVYESMLIATRQRLARSLTFAAQLREVAIS